MGRPAPSRSGQHPDAVVAGKAEYQQPAQVDRGHPQRPPRLVALDPPVGHSPAAVSDQPGQRALHHRPPAPVALLERLGHRAAPSGAQLVLVRMQADRAALLGGGAAPAQRAALAPAGEAGLARAVIGATCPGSVSYALTIFSRRPSVTPRVGTSFGVVLVGLLVEEVVGRVRHKRRITDVCERATARFRCEPSSGVQPLDEGGPG
jgi:hypothetical protein